MTELIPAIACLLCSILSYWLARIRVVRDYRYRWKEVMDHKDGQWFSVVLGCARCTKRARDQQQQKWDNLRRAIFEGDHAQ